MSIFPHIPVFINHRPVFGLSPLDLVWAFQTLGEREEGQGCVIDRAHLLTLLQENGTQLYSTVHC